MTRARDAASIFTAAGVRSITAGLSADGSIKLDGNYPTGTRNVALGDQALDDGSLSLYVQ